MSGFVMKYLLVFFSWYKHYLVLATWHKTLTGEYSLAAGQGLLKWSLDTINKSRKKIKHERWEIMNKIMCMWIWSMGAMTVFDKC